MTIAKPNGERAARCRGHYQLPGLEIQVEETVTIIPAQERQCPCGFLFRLANGELVGGGVRSTEPEPTWRRSRDSGRTWYEAPAWPTFNVHQFPDGELIHFGQAWNPWLQKTDRVGVYHDVVYRSTDDGHTHRAETVELLDLPELAEAADATWGHHVDAYVDHAIVALRDDSLLASVRGRFSNDRKTRTFVVRSTDRGRTWRYRSTVAFDLTEGDRYRIQGFSEPDLLALPGGELLCFMRTGGTYDGRHTPLYSSRSIDDGHTWSAPDPIADRGVFPKACAMSNGVLAVVYGRPGDWLAFSLNQGHTWMGHFCLHLGPQAWDCGSYDWILQVAPDTLLAAYGQTDPNDPRKSAVLGTFITVKRT